MITVDQIQFTYDGRITLDDISFRVDPGSTLGLIGPNGSGKSTLLRLMYRALRPASGSVVIDTVPVQRLRGRELASRLAVVAQEAPPDTPVTVAETVLLGRSPWVGAFQGYSRADRIAAAAALEHVGARALADRRFATLSGGERQRVLIARALAQQADHLLLDEPTNHLDIRYQHELLTLVRGLTTTTTVVVLHELNLAARYCDRLVLLDQGRVAAAGTVAEVLTPQVLEPVYKIPVRRTAAFGAVQLLFGPAAAVTGEASEHGNHENDPDDPASDTAPPDAASRSADHYCEPAVRAVPDHPAAAGGEASTRAHRTLDRDASSAGPDTTAPAPDKPAPSAVSPAAETREAATR
jgi:iron complex transport system ATP-binding protein